jgi:GNAT superfamily N-acetyltransferase
MSRPTVLAPHARGGVALRPAGVADEPFLRELFAQARPHLQLIPLDPEPLHALIDLQWRAQAQGYAATHPAAEHLVIEHRGMPVGRLVLDHGVPFEIVDLAICTSERNKGVGSATLEVVIARADERRRDIRLRVATDNPARRLYARYGFREVARTGLDLVMERRAT